MSDLEFRLKDDVYSVIHGKGVIVEIAGINIQVQFSPASGDYTEWYSTSGSWNRAPESNRHLFFEPPMVSFKTTRPYEPKFSKDKIYVISRTSDPESLIPIQVYAENETAIWFVYMGATINNSSTIWINGYKQTLSHEDFKIVGEI